jgi:hypothetical protein
MLSKNNLQITTGKGYEFIIGERLKTLPKAIQNPLLDLSNYKQEWIYNEHTDEPVTIKYTTLNHDGKIIIATYSANRAKKDKQDREDKIATAKKLLENPSLPRKKPARYFLQAEKKASGTYLRILESYRNAAGQSTHRILYTLGKLEDYTPEQLRAIGIKLFELGGGEVKALLQGDLEELGRYNYGYQQIYG